MRTIYVREWGITIAGPMPGFMNFMRWLFDPSRVPVREPARELARRPEKSRVVRHPSEFR